MAHARCTFTGYALDPSALDSATPRVVFANLESVDFIAQVLVEKEGAAAKYVFCFSFLVACYSAAMTTFLGAAIAIRSLMAPSTEEADPSTLRESAVMPPWEGDLEMRFSADIREDLALRASSSIRESTRLRASSSEAPPSATMHEHYPDGAGGGYAGEEAQPMWDEKGWRFRGIVVCMLIGDFCICSLGIPIDTIVFTASMTGGVLQPFLMWALLRCANDASLMGIRPQGLCANLWMFLSVAICGYLAVDGVSEALGLSGNFANIAAAAATAVAMLYMAFWLRRNATGQRYEVQLEGIDHTRLLE